MRVTNVDTKEKDFQVGVYSSIDELLHDSMEESENEYNEMDFDKKYLTGLDSEEEKLGAEDFRSESDTNNNELMSVEKNIDFDVISEEESHNSDYESKAKHNQKDEVVPVTTNISKMKEDMNVANNQPSQVPPLQDPPDGTYHPQACLLNLVSTLSHSLLFTTWLRYQCLTA